MFVTATDCRSAGRIAGVLALLCAGSAQAYSGGIAGRSGNPDTNGGAFCTFCHTYTVAKSYTADLTGLALLAPSAGTTYTLALTKNSGVSAAKAGFDISSRRLTGTGGTGSFTAGTDQRVTTAGDGFAGELVHSTPQVTNGSGNASWSISFTAPAEVGTLRLYVCSNPVDGNGGEQDYGAGNEDGPADCDVHDLTINGTPNAVDDGPAVNEDSTTTLSPLANDTTGASGNDQNDAFTITNLGARSNGGSATITGGGTTISYTPAANYNGTETFTYTVTDSLGAVDTATITVSVAAVADAPVADDDAFGVIRNSGANALAVLTGDADPDGTTPTISAVTQGTSGGTVVITGGGTGLTYAPATDYTGADTFTYTITDGALTDTATVTVTVASIASNDAFSVAEDSGTTAFNVLANDTGGTGAKVMTSVGAVSPPAAGTVTLTGSAPNQRASFTPAANYNGSASFSYSVQDAALATDTATVNVTITSVNDAPSINALTGTSAIDGVTYSYTVGVTDVDAGETFTFALVSGDPGDMDINTGTGQITWAVLPCASELADYSVGPITVSVSDGDVTVTSSYSILVDVQDTDADGMPNCYEVAEGFDPDDGADGAADRDGDGRSNADEFACDVVPAIACDPDADDVAPELTVPENVVVPATGYLTAVDLGTATAIDVLDGALAPTAEPAGPFRPGRHTITWTATDLAGNEATAEQDVDVLPLVSFNVDQSVGEPGSASVTATLNGDPPEYPVTVSYTVGGSATSPADYTSTATPGTLTIGSGTTTTFTVSVVDDGVPEALETVVFTATGATQAALGPRPAHTVSIVAENVAPAAAMTVMQDGEPRAVVYRDDGMVTLGSAAADANGDTIVYYWGLSDAALGLPIVDADSIEIDPAGLAAGSYPVRLLVSDGEDSTLVEVLLVVAETLPSLGSTDTDGDGTDDDDEGVADFDGDGIADWRDAIDDPAVLYNQTGEIDDAELLETEPGLTLRLGPTALAAGRSGALITATDLLLFGTSGGALTNGTDEFDNVGGIFDFDIGGVVPGDSARVVLPLQTAVRPGARYRKFTAAAGWHDFVVDAANAVHSAYSTDGVCPGPAASGWAEGVLVFADCLRLTLQDGGPNDADGLANGMIRDPGGAAVAPVTDPHPAPALGASGGGAFAAGALVLLGLLGLRRRRVRA